MDQQTRVSRVALSMDWVVNKIVMMWNVAQMYVFFFILKKKSVSLSWSQLTSYKILKQPTESDHSVIYV